MKPHELKNVNGAVYGKKCVDCGKGCGHDQTYGCGLKGRSELRSVKSKFLSASTARWLLVSSLALLCRFVVVGRCEAADEISLAVIHRTNKRKQ